VIAENFDRHLLQDEAYACQSSKSPLRTTAARFRSCALTLRNHIYDKFTANRNAIVEKETHMSEENKELIRRWFEEVWNNGRADAIDEMFAEEGLAHGLSDVSGNSPLRGPAAFREFHKGFREAFPDIIVTVEDTIAEGDQVAARCTARGQHQGDTLGFAATNNQMEITGIAMCVSRTAKSWRLGITLIL
jgi:steroid delta-isomerase-like uncharacterized protein